MPAIPASCPVVIRGLAADWPLVQPPNKAAYLKQFDSGSKTDMSIAATGTPTRTSRKTSTGSGAG